MVGESDDSYAEIVESLSKVNDLLDRLRAEPPSSKRMQLSSGFSVRWLLLCPLSGRWVGRRRPTATD